MTSFVDGKYQTASVSYTDYETAFNNATYFDEHGNPKEYKKSICLYRATDHNYVFTIDSVLYFLEDYLSATNRLKTLHHTESNLWPSAWMFIIISMKSWLKLSRKQRRLTSVRCTFYGSTRSAHWPKSTICSAKVSRDEALM